MQSNLSSAVSVKKLLKWIRINNSISITVRLSKEHGLLTQYKPKAEKPAFGRTKKTALIKNKIATYLSWQRLHGSSSRVSPCFLKCAGHSIP